MDAPTLSRPVTSPDVTETDPLFPATDPAAVEEHVHRQREEALAAHLFRARAMSEVGQTLLAAVSVYVFWPVLDRPVLIAWFVLFTVLAGLRGLWRRRIDVETEEPSHLRQILRRDIWISAALWAVLVLLLTGVPEHELAMIVIIVAGLIAAATSTMVADTRAFLGFMGILLGSLVVLVGASGLTRDHVTLLLVIALYAPFMVTVHARAHRMLVSQVETATRLRMSERATARGRDFLNALVSNAPSAIVVLDELGRVVGANPAFERITGLRWDQVRGRRLPELVPHPDDQRALERFLESVEEGAATVAELRFRGRSAGDTWLRISGTIAGEEAAGRMILVAEDVTEAVRAREAQERARADAEAVARAKSAFLASMSHEIRTPMNGILGMLELVMDTDLTDEQLRALRVVKSSADGLLRILNDILDVSKIEAGQLDLESVVFSLPEVANDAAQVFGGQAASKGVELVVGMGEDVPDFVRGDPTRLRQVLSNLVSNAVKFTDEGEVVLSVQRVGGDDETARVRFSVRDTGIGIAEEHREAIFSEFVQADQSTTRVYGGTGLGLAISRRLVELMGGHLDLVSAPGEGSEFSFTVEFPVATGVRRPRTTSTATLTGKRVLVVDDNATARQVASEALKRAGARVDEADSAAGALERMRAAAGDAQYDAVVLDHLMPNGDGFELAEAVVADPSLRHVKLIMLTSSAASSERARARELGVGAYLSKPVARDDLLKAVGAVLSTDAPPGGERRLITEESLHWGARDLSILLAEDNAVNQQVALALLGKRGYRVDLVENGYDAWQAVKKGAYDVVLMDIQMPRMDGLEAARRIREEGYTDLPIIALTAHAFQEERQRTVEAGMNDFLAKPFKPDELYAVIDKWTRPGGRRGETPEPRVREMEGEGTPPVDVEGFRAVMREAGIEAVVDSTLQVYVGEAPTLMERLSEAVAAGDLEGARAAAHSLKSSSGNIRATRLAELLQQLEEAAGSDDAGGVREVFERVQEEYRRVMDYLRSL